MSGSPYGGSHITPSLTASASEMFSASTRARTTGSTDFRWT